MCLKVTCRLLYISQRLPIILSKYSTFLDFFYHFRQNMYQKITKDLILSLKVKKIPHSGLVSGRERLNMQIDTSLIKCHLHYFMAINHQRSVVWLQQQHLRPNCWYTFWKAGKCKIYRASNLYPSDNDLFPSVWTFHTIQHRSILESKV